jgi:polyhydroxyalkanoate synthesis regulator phasin
MTDDRKREPGEPFRDGVRAVTGILGALKDAIEETFDDLRERGDISPERAREAARSTMRKAQEAMDDVRDRVDFVSRREYDELRAEVAALRAQLEAHTRSHGAPAPAKPAAAAAAEPQDAARSEDSPDGVGAGGAAIDSEIRDRWTGGSGNPRTAGGTGSPGGVGGTAAGTTPPTPPSAAEPGGSRGPDAPDAAGHDGENPSRRFTVEEE